MADTNNYLHSLYPNLRPQIDEAVTSGYSYQEIQDHIAGRVNEARRNGYNDEEIEGYTGGKLATAKQGYNPFLSQLYKAAGALNKGVAGFTKGITEPGQYINEKLGIGRSKAVDDIVNGVIETYKNNEDYWERRAKEKGATFVDEIVGEAIGGGIPGVLEFALGVPYYIAQGAIEARSQGQNEVIGAVQGAIKRVLLGKLFHSFGALKQPLKAVAMGGTMAGETAGAGGTPEEIAKAGGVGVIFSLGGKGRIGIREIKDLHTGEVRHEPVVRSDADVFKSESDLSDVVMKKAREEAIPPTGQDLELMPKDYPSIKGVAIEANGKVYEAKVGEVTHVQVMLSNGLKPEESVSGYTKTNGEFITQPGQEKITPRLRELEGEENLMLRAVNEGKKFTPEDVTKLDEIKAEKVEEAKKTGTELREPTGIEEPKAVGMREETVYHGSDKEIIEVKEFKGLGMHFGTKEQATQRVSEASEIYNALYLHEARIKLKNPLWIGEEDVGRAGYWEDWKYVVSMLRRAEKAIYSGGRPQEPTLRKGFTSELREKMKGMKGNQERLNLIREQLKSEGYDGIEYINMVEAAREGDVSYIIFDREQVEIQRKVKIPFIKDVGYKGPEEILWEKGKQIEKPIPAAPPVVEGKEWKGSAYRAETGYAHDKEQTAADVVRYEQEELGNKLGVTPDVISKLENYSATDLIWITKRKKDTKRYGGGVKYEVPPGSRVIAEDEEGGYLVLKGKLEVTPPIAAAAGERGLIRTTIIDEEAIYGGGPGTHTGDVLGKYGVIPEGKKIETGWTKIKEFDEANPRSGFMTNEEATDFIKGGTRTPEGEAYDKFIEETTKGRPEGVGAEKARKETKLYGTLLEQQKQAEENLIKLANLAVTNPKAAFLAGNVEALEDYAVRVDKGVFETKMSSLHPFGDNSIWMQEGYDSSGDFWNKVTQGNREAAKSVFDRNWKKVGELAGNIDSQIDKMVNTAERMSREAFNSGDKLGAAREHKKLMDLKKNRETIKREHEKLKNEVDSMTGKMKDWATMESIDPEYRDQIQTILEDYDLHRRGEAYREKRQSTLDFIAKQEELGETVFISEDKIRKLRKVPINDVTIEELRNTFDVVEQLAHLGKLKKKLILARKSKDFAENKTELLTSIKENALNYVEPADKDVSFPSEREPKSWWGRFRSKVANFSGATKVEYIADKLDGFKGKMYEFQGKAYDLIFRPSTIAEASRIRLIQSDLDALNSIVEPVKKDFLHMMREQENVEGRDMTRMEMISVYWNSRNEGNRETLRRGLNLTDESIDNITGRLTPAEIKFANDIMTLIQSKGPKIAEVLRTLTGEKMKLETNYFPIWFDYELSERASQRQQETDLMKQVYMKVGAERGFTVSRVGGVDAPYLSFDVVLKHLEKVNHFISSAEAIRDVQKVVFDKDIRRAIESSAGEGSYREIVEWLKDWGNPKRGGYQGDLDRWFGILRHNATLAVLGFKLSTTILQPTAYLQLINRIGFKNSMVGLIDFYKDPHGNTTKIYELSPFMRTRSHSFDRDLMDYMNSDSFYTKSQRMKEVAMGMISALDLATTLPAWQSAFNLGVKQFGWNEARAVEYADKVTRRTQASGMPKDLPGVLRGSNFKKSLTMFYTYFSSTYNEAMRDYRAFKAGEENAGNLVKSFMLLFVLPAVIQVLIRKREKTEAKDFAGELVGNVAGTIPYVGPIVNAIITGYDYQASPIFEMPKQITMAIKSKDWEKRLEHTFMAAGYAMGFPSRQTILTIKYLGDVLSGRSYDPANLIYREQKKKKGEWK